MHGRSSAMHPCRAIDGRSAPRSPCSRQPALPLPHPERMLMKMFRYLPLCLAVSAACTMPAQAQSLVELYESARASDATYQSAKAQYEANLAKADQGRAQLLPTANLTGGASRNFYDNTVPRIDRDFTA